MNQIDRKLDDLQVNDYVDVLFERHTHLERDRDLIMVAHLAVIYVLLDNAEEMCFSGGDRYAPDMFQKLLATALRYEIELGITPASRARLLRGGDKEPPEKDLDLSRMIAPSTGAGEP